MSDSELAERAYWRQRARDEQKALLPKPIVLSLEERNAAKARGAAKGLAVLAKWTPEHRQEVIEATRQRSIMAGVLRRKAKREGKPYTKGYARLALELREARAVSAKQELAKKRSDKRYAKQDADWKVQRAARIDTLPISEWTNAAP